ncbi:hypothetical protein [Paenibacillus protaetiae]|uniref:hypothetical protein n=1 Tax=Paenibacillus protaetiae TaxID=2509456 RepID=UPI001FC95C25|nr:hypothetical protein [Paenibacillus protaetiae]
MSWLDMAFPADEYGGTERQEPEEDEAALREQLLNPKDQDQDYINQVLYIMKNHPMVDQQLLALERSVYIQAPEVTDIITEWLESEPVHPVVQFHALQCLRKRGLPDGLHWSALANRSSSSWRRPRYPWRIFRLRSAKLWKG